MAKDSYEDIVKARWDVTERVVCQDYLELRKDGKLEIEHTSCHSRALVNELEIIDQPEFMKGYDFEKFSIYFPTYQ